MTDVLSAIVERKRREVADRLRAWPVPATPTRRSLRAALSRPGARFIMEVKRKSPSGHQSRISVAEAVAAYAPVADAISVLTDGPGFGGSLDDLRMVRQLFDGPILAKDFIVDPAQVSEARAAGADAVLAMMSVLDDMTAAAVIAEARRYNMDVIVEAHDEDELARAIGVGASIIGINNRNLRTLTTDLSVTERLAPLAPRGIILIAESGISSRADVERLAPRVDAFLVGSSLMASSDIIGAARSLVHGSVKLCGLTRAEDVEFAARAGATHAGFIFVPGTPRAIDLTRSRELAEIGRESGLKIVGVFRDAETGEMVRAADELQLDAVQLHGIENAAAVRRALPETTEIWALCGVDKSAASARTGADRSLFDTISCGSSGGTGRAFDWSKLDGRDDLPSAFLGGGIGPQNAKAASKVGAYGLDVGSSVEAAPGIKDAAKIEALFVVLRPPARGDA
jgi:indole-3-glycerol phosphate synthase/phosphoribosylanthranilate isomerase